MTYLRSNSSQSVHVDFNSLRNFARDRGIDPWNTESFALPYHRPSIQLFNEHAQFCLEQYQLNKIHIHGVVDALLPGGGVRVSGKDLPGMVLYAGGDNTLFLPQWARGLSNALHVFSDAFHKNMAAPSSCIIGGGISALQLAIALARQGKAPRLITRRPLEIFRFDFNPCYVGPQCQSELDREHSEERRMKKILEERFSGTVPQEIFDEFQELLNEQALGHEIIPDEMALAERVKDSAGAIFCTGFEQSPAPDPLLRRPGQKFIYGYPVLGKKLRWAEEVFVGGKNAAYRIGPAAANIIGAHLAWRVIKRQLV